MTLAEVRGDAFAMPLTSPGFPRGPYRFVQREFVTITYRTDPKLLRAIVPEPLELGGARTLDVDTDMSGIGEGDDREITCAREADVGRLSHRGGREQARSAVLVSAAARALVDQHDLRDRHVVKARRLSPEERVGWYGGVRDHEPTPRAGHRLRPSHGRTRCAAISGGRGGRGLRG